MSPLFLWLNKFINKMTVDQILQQIHRTYELNADYPASGEDDYALRLGLVNDAITKWSQQESVLWRELYTSLSAASTGTKTTTINVSSYATPTDFASISSFPKITSATGSLYYPFAKNDEVMNLLRDSSSKQFFYISGKPGAYKINFNPAASATGNTISYDYYKTPAVMTSGSDVPEMSRPLYIVYDVLASLYEGDIRTDMVTKYLQLAKGVMDEMIVLNEVPPSFNSDQIDDLDYKLSGVRFGE